MANTKSAEKRGRQAEKRRVRNRSVTTHLRTTIKKTRESLAENTGDDAVPTLQVAYSVIDKAAKKGVLKKNTADRYKSRLTKASRA